MMMESGREEGDQTSGTSEAQEGSVAVEKEGVGRKEEEGGRDGEGDAGGGDAGGGDAGGGDVGGGDAGEGDVGGGDVGGGDVGGGDVGGGDVGGGDAGGGDAGGGDAGGGDVGGGDAGGGGESTSAVMEVRKKSGRAKKKEKRLKNEPPSLTGEGPSGIHVLDYAEARALELSNMVRALKSKGGTKRTFQLLPRHMRRRAMSHNVKRLPRRLRKAATKEMEKSASQSASKKMAPTRKQRRKAPNLLQSYTRRQRQHVWLETHIWHAKRMKMVDKYGYRLAEHSNDKGIRATYRSLMYGCLLSDISYYCCIEIEGKQEDIIASLRPLFSSETGLTIAAKAYKSGQREGRAVVYRSRYYPYSAIGPVQFLWQMQTLRHIDEVVVNSAQSPVPKLWVWCHPGMYKEVLSEVQAVVESFNSRQSDGSAVRKLPSSTTSTITGEGVMCKAGESSTASQPSSSTMSTSTGGEVVASQMGIPISVKSLKDELVRFRLIGPRSHALLMEMLKPVFNFQLCQPPSSPNERPVPPSSLTASESESSSLPDIPKWWKYHQSSAEHAKILSLCYPIIKSASNPAEFSRGIAIGMTVSDPRLFIPSKRTDMVSAYYPPKVQDVEVEGQLEGKENSDSDASDLESSDDSSFGDVESNSEESDSEPETCDDTETGMERDQAVPYQEIEPDSVQTEIQSLPLDVAYSPIWDPSIRETVSKFKMSNHNLNLLRSKQFLKSDKLKLGEKASHIPVLLIQQSHQPWIPLGREAPASKSQDVLSSSSSHLGSGWDIIMPSNWAMAFWIGLIYRGARACGMRELRKCSLETLVPHFPEDFPDTHTGQQCTKAQKQQLEQKFKKYPPDKRRNYGKLLIQHPFHQPWERLTEKWSRPARLSHFLSELHFQNDDYDSDEDIFSQPPAKRVKADTGNNASLLPSSADQGECQSSTLVAQKTQCKEEHTTAEPALSQQEVVPSFYVLRSRDALTTLNQFLHYLFNRKSKLRAPHPDPATLLQQAIQEFGIDVYLERHSKALILVQFEVLQRGLVGERAAISVPTAADLRSLNTKKKAFSGPTEILHPKGMTLVENGSVYIGVSSLTRKEIKEVKTVRKHPHSEGVSDLRRQCAVEAFKLHPPAPSRHVCGYTTSAGYRLSTSKYGGLGLCSFAGLLEVVNKCFLLPGVTQLVALVRGETVQHRFIKLSLLH